MARPTKTGLMYFNLDCENDLKTKILIKKFSIKAYGFYIYLLQQIYKENYYLKLSEEEKEFLFLESGLEYSEANKLFLYLLDNNFFNKKLWEKEKILTSKGLQIRYCKIINDTKRNQKINEFSLINSEETTINSEETMINSEETTINSEEMPQSKLKESKLKENKHHNAINSARAQDISDEEIFLNNNNSKFDSIIEDWNSIFVENFKFQALPLIPPAFIREQITAIKEIWDTPELLKAINNSKQFLQNKKFFHKFWHNPENIKKALAGNFSDDNFKNKTQKQEENEQIEVSGVKLDKWITVEGVKYEKYYYEPKDMASQLLYENKAEEEYEKTKSVEKSRELILKNLKKFDYVKRFHYHKDNFKRWLVLLINSNIKMRLKKMGIENLGEAEQYVQYI
ncbi:MAG TPA: DUF4373 domain-containing protein [bacterium]|nr:DUF4373 domain-containing protein [bacterium]HPN32604.1 DUF4373 domain-containing protein [bacterium]